MHIQISTSFQGVWFDEKQIKILRLGNKPLDSAIPLAENKTIERVTHRYKRLITKCSSPFDSYHKKLKFTQVCHSGRMVGTPLRKYHATT